VTREGGAPAILVGSLVRVARPVGGGPVNREGHTGRVIDIAGDRHGREALVQYSGETGPGQERWVPLRYLVPASAPSTLNARITQPVDFEHHGIDEHLDAIEDAIAKARRTPTYDAALSMRHLGTLGVVVTGKISAHLAHRAELVEKSA
jgi:hypothetical protein